MNLNRKRPVGNIQQAVFSFELKSVGRRQATPRSRRLVAPYSCCASVSRLLLGAGLPTPVVGRSPDRPTCEGRQSVNRDSPECHGRETVPQHVSKYHNTCPSTTTRVQVPQHVSKCHNTCPSATTRVQVPQHVSNACHNSSLLPGSSRWQIPARRPACDKDL